MGKVFWKSKYFWVNLIGLIAFVLQSQFGFILSPEVQAMILTFINFILRFFTKEAITWTSNNK